jgi:hypothetical protein
VPIALAEKALELRDYQSNDQVGDEEGDGTMHFSRRMLLEHGKERQQNKNGARINDLPLEVLPIGLMGAHARGRSS